MSLPSARTLTEVKGSMKRETILLGQTQRHTIAKAGEPDDRDQTVLHPSDLSKEKWCPKQDWYRITQPKLELVDTSFQMENIYEEGHEIHRKWQLRWSEMGILWGRWHCHACGKKWVGLSQPDKPCINCSAGWYAVEYKEYPLILETHLIEGSTDGVIVFIDPETGDVADVYLTEVKSIGVGTVRFEWPALHRRIASGEVTMEQAWKDIKRPFPSHMIQGMIYVHNARATDHPLLSKVRQIIFIYECKWNQGVKEFVVSYRRELIQEKLDDAAMIKAAVDTGIEPERPWNDPNREPCKKCPYRKECWNEPETDVAPPAPRVQKVAARKRRAAFKKLGAAQLEAEPVYDIPGIPRNLTELSDQRLMQFFSEYVSWENYFSTQVADAEIAEKRADAELTRVEAVFMLQAGRSKVTEARWEKDAAEDPKVAKAQHTQLQAWAHRKAMQDQLENLGRASNLISRELTRRTNRNAVHSRQDRANP